MRKIAFAINYIEKNGPSRVVLNIINNLDREKYEIYLITLFDGNNKEVLLELRNKGIGVYECKTLSRTKCLLGECKEFENIINKEHFDVLHTHGIIPDILSSRLHTMAKRITTLHSNMFEDYPSTYGNIKGYAFIALHLMALNNLDMCVCCSKSVYDVMRGKLKSVSFICNGIESAQAHSAITRVEVGVPKEARVFLYAGVLNARKNIVWLIEKFVQHHKDDEYLLVLGSGENETKCKEKADDHVRMLGFQTDPIAYMNISDVYVSASKSEGFSISVLEALSCGLGLFLSDIPSHREVVEMGQNVYLGEIFSSGDFEIKLNALRERKTNSAEIRAFQEKELSAKSMAAGYQKRYEEQ